MCMPVPMYQLCICDEYMYIYTLYTYTLYTLDLYMYEFMYIYVGSIYIPEKDKKTWKSLTDRNKLIILLYKQQYIWLSFELFIHILLIIYLLYLRFITFGIIISDSCSVI